MSHYVCAYVPGGSCFFTVALLECHRRLLTEHVAALRAAFVSVRRQRPFHLDAIVVLPDHLHCLWTLPPDDADYSTRWRSIEASFARTLAPGERLLDRRQQKGERGIWQRRFWEHAIRDQRDFNIHCDYIHYNRSNMALWRGWPNRWPVADAGRTRSASANRVVCGNRPSRTILRDGLSHKEGEMIDELDCA